MSEKTRPATKEELDRLYSFNGNIGSARSCINAAMELFPEHKKQLTEASGLLLLVSGKVAVRHRLVIVSEGSDGHE